MHGRTHRAGTYRIAYPVRCGLHDFDCALYLGGLDPRRPPARLIFNHDRILEAPVDVLIRMACLYNRLVASGCDVVVEWDPMGATFGWADRSGFFTVLDRRVEVVPGRPGKVTGRYPRGPATDVLLVGLSSIRLDDLAYSESTLNRIEDGVAATYAHTPGAALAAARIRGCASEAVCNVHRHSKAPVPGILAVQRYLCCAQASRIKIVICDGGLGLLETLRGKCAPGASVERRVLAAFQRGFSWYAAGHTGAGLPKCGMVTEQYGGAVRVRTGSVDVRLAAAGGALRLADYLDDLPFFQGTEIVFDLHVGKAAICEIS